jgi:hypothetical protein
LSQNNNNLLRLRFLVEIKVFLTNYLEKAIEVVRNVNFYQVNSTIKNCIFYMNHHYFIVQDNGDTAKVSNIECFLDKTEFINSKFIRNLFFTLATFKRDKDAEDTYGIVKRDLKFVLDNITLEEIRKSILILKTFYKFELVKWLFNKMNDFEFQYKNVTFSYNSVAFKENMKLFEIINNVYTFGKNCKKYKILYFYCAIFKDCRYDKKTTKIIHLLESCETGNNFSLTKKNSKSTFFYIQLLLEYNIKK